MGEKDLNRIFNGISWFLSRDQDFEPENTRPFMEVICKEVEKMLETLQKAVNIDKANLIIDKLSIVVLLNRDTKKAKAKFVGPKMGNKDNGNNTERYRMP